jgi:protein gp37
MSTGIQWTDETWLMWPGCVPASPGCANCYARRDAWRLSYNPNPKVSAPYQGIVKKVLADGTEILAGEDHRRRRDPGVLKFTGLTRFLPERLAIPLRWRKPRRIFVSANSDLFLPSRVATEQGRRQIAAVFGVMAVCKRHTFQVLTKWPGEACKWFAWLRPGWGDVMQPALEQHLDDDQIGQVRRSGDWPWPLPNVWIGTSVEDQPRADDRIPKLLQVPAALRFLSCEPLLGPIDLGLKRLGDRGIDWVIVGGESNGRPCDVAWIRSIVEQCKSAGVTVFVKQLGSDPRHGLERLDLRHSHGGDASEWPEDLRVREMPEAS